MYKAARRSETLVHQARDLPARHGTASLEHQLYILSPVSPPGAPFFELENDDQTPLTYTEYSRPPHVPAATQNRPVPPVPHLVHHPQAARSRMHLPFRLAARRTTPVMRLPDSGVSGATLPHADSAEALPTARSVRRPGGRPETRPEAMALPSLSTPYLSVAALGMPDRDRRSAPSARQIDKGEPRHASAVDVVGWHGSYLCEIQPRSRADGFSCTAYMCTLYCQPYKYVGRGWRFILFNIHLRSHFQSRLSLQPVQCLPPHVPTTSTVSRLPLARFTHYLCNPHHAWLA